MARCVYTWAPNTSIARVVWVDRMALKKQENIELGTTQIGQGQVGRPFGLGHFKSSSQAEKVWAPLVYTYKECAWVYDGANINNIQVCILLTKQGSK